MLNASNLTVFFENAIAINDLSIDVNKGEIIGIIGPNSAGKTTLMNVLSGLIIDTQIKEKRKGGERITLYGTITFNNKDITNVPAPGRAKDGIVLCRERHPIFPESSVNENLKMAGYLRTRKEIKEKMHYVYDVFPALVALKHRKAGFLSGGEQQMLAIGMALIVGPTLLLLDEPLLGLSPVMQKTVMNAIVSLNKKTKITVVLSEQFARPVLPVIDRGYVIENGMLALVGTGQELMNNPEIQSAYLGI